MSSLWVNETKITTENALNWDHFAGEGNHKTNNDEKTSYLSS